MIYINKYLNRSSNLELLLILFNKGEKYMKKIIPFVKDINFNTSIYEISSISLEHNLKLVNGNEIKGEFIISGDYKQSDNTINSEPFIFNIPYDIDLDYKYNNDNVKIDIDNFDYELERDDSLKLNISISLDLDEEIETIEDDDVIIDKIDDDIKEVEEIMPLEEDNSKEELNEEREVSSIFDNFDKNDEKYVTYHVHIFREKDDINEIIKMYNTTKEELEEYNDLSNITLGSKLIIPSNE